MSLGYDECSLCRGRVRQRGDHTCPRCADELGRETSQPFWGDFANHPDAALRSARTDFLRSKAA